MGDTNSFLVQNKLITIDQIKEITEYLKKTLNHYNDLIKQELQENNNANFYQGHYKHYVYTKPSLEFSSSLISSFTAISSPSHLFTAITRDLPDSRIKPSNDRS